ncbi:hypothetical protein Bbelb_217870 [Branchiostoma belcheri]|nr:hypothetical protein Bbelb_217870 [Branchiostoma belcheri]
MDNWACSKALVFLCISVLWWGPEVFGLITGQQAAHLKRRVEEVKVRVDEVNLKVVNTRRLLNSLAETGLLSADPASCLDVKSSRRSAQDGEYTLYPLSFCGDTPFRVYCHNMSSDNPQEFLTLPAGPDNNFAHRYGPRLQWSGAIWYRCTGPLFGYWGEAGYTKFSKVRIAFEESKVRIIQDDHTFATTEGNNYIPYGTAGDCYSPTQGCAKGTFQVDLTGTELVLAPGVQWGMFATWPGELTINDMYISEDRKVASARCGGWCGHCVPQGNLTLSHPQCRGAASCLEMKSRRRGSAEDGENILYPFSAHQDKSVSVYCHNMSSDNPQEFLTLPAGPDNNFAHRYGPRLQWSSAIWYRCTGPLFVRPTSGATVKTERGEQVTTGNRTRVVRLAVTNANHYTKRGRNRYYRVGGRASRGYYVRCGVSGRSDVAGRGYWGAMAGTTKFSKVRISFEDSNIRVILDDYTFATTEGKYVPYGMAGDCYSPTQGCAKGTFQVDLTGTEFVLAPGVQWGMFATWPGELTINDMSISADRTVVSGRCGGWCGNCGPVGEDLLLSHRDW